MREAVEKVLVEVRALLRPDGGDVELVEVTSEGIVRVRLKGLCADCGGSLMTLRQGLERMVQERVPNILRVETL